MAPSKFLCLLLSISMIFICNANSATSNSKIYENVCNDSYQGKDFAPNCLNLLKPYPEITSANDYLTFIKLFIRMVGIDKTKRSEQQMKEFLNKYPSSEVIKDCVDKYDTVVGDVKISLVEEPSLISLDLRYAIDALQICDKNLANEKVVDTTAIARLNYEVMLHLSILEIASRNV
ncbi:hypothetical protein P8452_01979 [Trifolium repens]|nr:hypothetical protein P8452_01979 [Trifolium repens]